LMHGMGIKVYMLTGDNIRTATVVGKDIGIASSSIIADVLPQGKVDCIKVLQSKGEHVAMIGDGVNDSPAIAQADVGIAIGAGTDVAIETASVVLMNSKLTDVVTSIDLCRTIFSRIRLNFLWALGYNTLALPIAGGALYPLIKMVLPPFMAGIAMVLSSLSVLCSSLHLNRYSPPHIKKHYGRKSRQGTLGIEELLFSAQNGEEVTIRVQCDSMKMGGKCNCSPDTCKCDLCGKHGDLTGSLGTKKFVDRTIYPGCAKEWGKPCNCLEDQCECSGCSNVNEGI